MTRDEIIGRDQSGGGMFAVMPSVVMRDPELPMSAKMLYGIITWRCNKNAYCWCSNRELGEDLNLSAKRVSALLSLLENNGHVEIEIIRNAETGQVLRRNIYPVVKSSRGILTEPEPEDEPLPGNEDTPPPKNGDTPPPKNEDTPPQECGDPPLKNEEKKYKEETKRESNTPLPPKGEKRASKYDLAEDAKPVLREYCGEDKELAWALASLIDVRREKRAINSKRGISALLAELDRLSQGDRQQKLLLLRQSTANSWKSVFPLKGGYTTAAAPSRVQEEEGAYDL